MVLLLKNTWALLLGVLLLMLGNGLQNTLLGVRGDIEDFSTFAISLVMSAYYIGFLGGSKLTPQLITRVGHVRVFAALGSFVSAIIILFPLITDPFIWFLLRVCIGFCFSGVYVVAESWLNDIATNETRGRSLSFYLLAQMIGVVSAQIIFGFGNPNGFTLFVVASVMVSVAFAPILLSASPIPAFNIAKPMSFRKLFTISPLACISIFFLGAVFSALFGMSAIYGVAAGFTIKQISAFVAMIYFGGMMMQIPIGWLSDRFDRRIVIILIAITGLIASILGVLFEGSYIAMLGFAFILGATSNPLYGIIISHMNDFLKYEDMPAAAGGLIFINGLGAIIGPVITGQLINIVGSSGFWVFLGIMMAVIAIYGTYRSTQRTTPDMDENAAYVPVSPTLTPIAIDAAVEHAIEIAQNEDEKNDEKTP